MSLATPTIPKQWKEAINLLQFNPLSSSSRWTFPRRSILSDSHSTLLSKLAELDLLTLVYNWLVDFFSGQSHHTVFSGDVSCTRSITVSIIQGSSIGPAAYTVKAANPRPLNSDNIFIKFADYPYLVISAANISTRTTEIDNVAAWAAENNLRLNKSKSKKVLFRDNRRGNLKTLPPPLPDISWESSLKILGIQQQLISVRPHPPRRQWQCADAVCEYCSTTGCWRRTPGSVPGSCSVKADTHPRLSNAVTNPRQAIESTAWRGFITASDIQRVDPFLRCI